MLLQVEHERSNMKEAGEPGIGRVHNDHVIMDSFGPLKSENISLVIFCEWPTTIILLYTILLFVFRFLNVSYSMQDRW